jgi:antirestriction protein
MADTPRIYVACLAAYNGGRLHGEWIDADQSADNIQEAIKRMLSRSPEPHAEEWAIHDHESFGGIEIKEYESIETVADIAAFLGEHGAAAVVAYNHYSDLEEARSALADHYYGEWSSLAEWAEDYLGDTGGLENVPESLRNYIDFERWADDLEMGGEIFSVEADGKLHIFASH